MKPRHLGLALVVVAVWGVNFTVTAVGLDRVPPVLLCALRFAVAAVPAVFVVGRPTVPWRWIAAVAASLAVVKFSLLYAGMAAGLPSGLAAVVLASQAIFATALGVLLLRERPRRATVAGLAVAVGGLALIGSRVGGDRPLAGFLLVLGAGAAWGFATIAMRRAAAPDALNLIVWVSAVAAPVLFALSLVVEGPAALGTLAGLDLAGWAAVGYIAYLSTLFGFGAWALLIRRYGAGPVAPFAMLAPVLAIASGAMFRAEPVHWYDVVGGLAVVGGVLVPGLLGRQQRGLATDVVPAGAHQ